MTNPHSHAHSHGTHNHDAGHGHHHHGPTALEDMGKAFAIGVGLNLIYVVVEATYGLLSHSMALLADAGHNFSDVLSLLLAWGAAVMATKSATYRHTYGFRRGTVLSALLSSLILLGALGAITLVSVQRLFAPEPVKGFDLILVAGIGVIINTATALLLMKGQHGDLNVRGAFLHMTQDALLSLGVVIAGIVIYFTGWLWLDPAASLVIVALIFWSTWQLFRESLNLSVDAVPAHIDIHAVKDYLGRVEGVVEVHDLHVWALSTTDVALTAHLVLAQEYSQRPQWLKRILADLGEFGIGHATIQVERAPITCEQGGCC